MLQLVFSYSTSGLRFSLDPAAVVPLALTCDTAPYVDTSVCLFILLDGCRDVPSVLTVNILVRLSFAHVFHEGGP